MKISSVIGGLQVMALAAAPNLAVAEGDSGPSALSANGLFLAGYTKKEVPDGAATGRTGLFAHQLEVHASASVDSSTAAQVTVAFPGDRGAQVTEAFVTTRLSEGLSLRAGRFYVDYGIHNSLRVHQYPFLDPPLVLERFFGPNGLDEVGLGLDWQLPTPWEARGSLQILNGDNRLWVNPTDEDLLYAARLATRWDVVRQVELQAGGSWAGGRNPTERWTHTTAVDMALSWEESGDGGRAATWQSEYIYARQDLRVETRKQGGLSSFLEYQSAGRWLARARYDYYGVPDDPALGWEDRFSVLLGLKRNPRFPLRFQYSRWRVDRDRRGYNQYHLQLNFSIGPHLAT